MKYLRLTLLSALALGAVLISGAGATPGTTTRVSLDSSGGNPNNDSGAAVTATDGRYVAFASLATDLVAGDLAGAEDVFVYDRQTNTTDRASVDSSELEGVAASKAPDLSDDGRYVAFESLSDNLIGINQDNNGVYDVFVRDRTNGTTERVSVSTAGVESNGASRGASISADGRYVAYYSLASNLIASDTNGNYDVFVRDRQTSTTTRVSVSNAGAEGLLGSDLPSISDTGRYVAFGSFSNNLVTGDGNGFYRDIFVRDTTGSTTIRASVSTAGVQENDESTHASISGDGRYVAFQSLATTLVLGDTNTCGSFTTPGSCPDVFVRDTTSNTTVRASVSSAGVQGDGQSTAPRISGNGRYVAYESEATNLVSGDTNTCGSFTTAGTCPDVFVRDTVNNKTGRVSLDSADAQANNLSLAAAMAGSGRLTIFASDASNLVTGDTNNRTDIFAHELADSDADSEWEPFDNCPNWSNTGQALPAWTVPAGDVDCDGWTSADEVTITTLALQQCPATTTPNDEDPDAWPPDFNDDRSVNITDVLAMKPYFNTSVPPTPPRYDIVPTGAVNITDILGLKPYFNKSCT